MNNKIMVSYSPEENALLENIARQYPNSNVDWPAVRANQQYAPLFSSRSQGALTQKIIKIKKLANSAGLSMGKIHRVKMTKEERSEAAKRGAKKRHQVKSQETFYCKFCPACGKGLEPFNIAGNL